MGNNCEKILCNLAKQFRKYSAPHFQSVTAWIQIIVSNKNILYFPRK